MAAASLALFLVAALWISTPKVLAAATYNWKSASPPVIHVTGYPVGQATFDLQCSPSNTGPTPEYNCQGSNGQQCNVMLKVSGNDISTAQVVTTQYSPVANTCTVTGTGPTPVSIGSTSKGPGGGSGSGNGSGSSSGASDNTSPSCESGGFSLNWIMCPVFNAVAESADWFFNSILQPFLITSPITTDATDPGYKIWSSFRVYGNIFLIIALLVVVFGQSIGGGLIDAYTAKKVMPRLLIAVILINLSIYIVAFLVDFTNIIGSGIGDLLTAPLRSSAACDPNNIAQCQSWSFKPSSAQLAAPFALGLVGFLAAGTTITGLLGAMFASGGVIAGLLAIKTAVVAAFFVLLPILLAVLAVFVVLVVRKGLILFLILISPVAFALYCLPNTEKYFKKWWELLFGALMVYPIIIVIFAIADIMTVTILSANNVTPSILSSGTGSGANGSGGALGSDQALALVIAFFLQFLPLLAIPFAFRFAGGALKQAHDILTGAGAKVNNASKTRTEIAKSDWQAKRAGGNKEIFTRLGNRKIGDKRLAERKGLFGYNPLAVLAEKYDQEVRNLGANLAKDPRTAALADDDPALKAMEYSSFGQAVKGLQENSGMSEKDAIRAARAVQASGGWNAARQQFAHQQLIKTGTGFTGYDIYEKDENGNFKYERDKKGEIQYEKDGLGQYKLDDNDQRIPVKKVLKHVTAMEEMIESINRVAGNNSSTRASLSGFSNAVTKQVGRNDLAPGFANVLTLAERQAKNGRLDDKDIDAAIEKAWESTGLGGLVQGKTAQTETFSKHFGKVLLNADTSTEEGRERVTRAAVATAELQQALPQAAAGHQHIINKYINNLQMKDATGNTYNLDRDDMAYRQHEAQKHNAQYGLSPADHTKTVNGQTVHYIDASSVPGRTIEHQLADMLKARGVNVTPEALRGRERAYDTSTSARHDGRRRRRRLPVTTRAKRSRRVVE